MCSCARMLVCSILHYSLFTIHYSLILGVPALSTHDPTHRRRAFPGFASLPYFAALRLSHFHHQSHLITALVPARTGFAALQIPNAFSNRKRFEKMKNEEW